MGQYLMIGLATRIVADKNRVRYGSDAMQNLMTELNNRFNTKDIYMITEDEECVYFDLKPEVAEEEMVDFLTAYYKLRFGEGALEPKWIIEDVSKLKKLSEWIDLAQKKEYENFQEGCLYYTVDNEKKQLCTSVMIEYIVLNMTGKIIMECFNDLFLFFTRLIREKLPTYRLAHSLFVSIGD
jgi:hypothetical protein